MKLLILAVLLAAIGAPAYAASAVGSGSANVLQPVAVVQTQALTFGNVVPPPSGSVTITMQPDGTISAGAGNVIGSRHQGTFALSGGPNLAVSVSVNSGFQLSGPGGSITASILTDLPSGNVVTLSPLGAATVNAGGSFSLSSSQGAGAYAGSFTVTADYQ